MKKISKKIISILVSFAMLLNYVLPISIVHAVGVYVITFTATGNHTMEKDGTNLKIDGQIVDFKDNGVSIGAVDCASATSCSITVNDTLSGVLEYNADNKFKLYNTNGHVEYNNSVINSNVVFMVEDYGNVNNNRATSNIAVVAGNGTYGNNRNYDADVEISINGSRWDHSGTIEYPIENAATKVTFTFETLWINRFYDNIVINGVSYNVSDYLNFDDRTEWLNANHGTQALSFDIPNVNKADSYNIVVKHGENTGKKYLATFLWTADPAQSGSHNYIGNSKLEFVKAVYNVGGTTYTVTEDDLNGKLQRDGAFLNATSDDGFLNYGVTADVEFDDGSLTLPGDADITMRVVPDYGYQVTDVNNGGDFTTTNSGVSEFTVHVDEGTAGYFQAEVTKVSDEVLANSDKVSSGSVEIASDEIDSGTVVLSVDDVNLTEDKIADFNNYAGENYNITSYLDINLNKVLYKGNSEDVWSEQIHHLKNKALITLKLEDGVDVNNIVIVHNIDNGDEFEIIEIESYDPETNTISFYTDSFSNYAIATKTTKTTNNPKTGDNINIYFVTLTIGILGFIGASLTINKRRKCQKN